MFHKINLELKEYLESVKLFQKNIRNFLWTFFFIGLGNSIYMLMYNLFLKEAGFKEGFIGSVLAAASLGSALFAIPIAIILPRIKIKNILRITPLLLAITILLQVFVIRKDVILVSSFIKGILFTIIMVISGPFYMSNSNAKERTHIFSISFAIMLASGFIGNIFGGLFYKATGAFIHLTIFRYQLTFTLAAFLILLSYFALEKISTKNMDNEHKGVKLSLKGFPYKFVLKIAIPQFIIGLGAGMIIPFLNLFFRYKFHMVPSRLGILFAISQAFMFVGILSGPIFKKYFGMMKSVVISQLLSIPFFYLLGFSNVFWIVAVSFFLRATLMNMSQPLVGNFTMEHVEKKFQFLTNSITSTAWTGAWIFSAFFGGKIIEKYGFNDIFIATITLYLISSILYYIFFIRGRSFSKTSRS
ncbi:MFS transporter [bacterium]|nr:MFS transporter [bacterium]